MKNKRKLSANNGVTISYSVEDNRRLRIPFFNEIMLTLLVITATVGAIMTFATILGLEISPSVVIPCIAFFSIIYTVLYKLIKKWRYLIILGVTLIVAIIVLVCFKDISKSIVILFEQAKATISEFMFWDEVPQTYKWQDGFLYLTNFTIVLLSVVLCSAISYFTIVKQSFIALFLLTFPFFEIGAAFGAVPNYFYFSLMLASWAAALTISRVSNSKIKMRRSNGEKQTSHIGGAKQKFAGVAVVMALIVVLLFTTATTVLNDMGFSRTENLDMLRQDAKYSFENFMDYISGVDHDGSLREGKLYNVDDRVIKNRHYITLETSFTSTEEPIKLKGYTATIYKNNSWNQTEQYEQYQSMFDEFAKSSYLIGADTGRLIFGTPQFDRTSYSLITLSDFRRKKPYVYETYFANFTPEFTPIYDSNVAPVSKSKYSYAASLSKKNLYTITDSTIYQSEQYKSAFAKYTEFVNHEYVKSEITEQVKALANSFEAADKFEYLNAVCKYFKENFESSDKSGQCPKGVDFVEHFLFTTKKGYSTHFASAAAVLMQAKGYPTRYVEGYYIPTEIFNNAQSDTMLNNKTFDITDAYAHAWIEVFDETYGWIPMEATPEYLDDNIIQTEQPEQQPEEDTPTPPEEEITTEIDTEIVDEDAENTVDGEKYDPPSMKFDWKILLIVLAVIIIAFCVRTIILISRKNRAYTSCDVNKKLQFAYRYLVLMAAYQNINIGNVYDYRKLTERLGDNGRYATVKQFEFIFDVLLKHTYSRTPATLDEANEVLSLLHDYSEKLYNNLPWFKKLSYRYFHYLY